MGRLELERRVSVPPHGDPIHLDVRGAGKDGRTSVVLVAHGFKGFKDWGFFPYLCEQLAEDGHTVVSFNFSLGGVGQDLEHFVDLDAFKRNTFTRELADLNWLIDQARAGVFTGDTPPSGLGLLGHSRGGGTAILAARTHTAVGSLVTWAAVSTFERWTETNLRDWEAQGVTHTLNGRTGQHMPLGVGLRDDLVENRDRLDILAAAAANPSPWLIVHGEDDEAVPVTEAHALNEASRSGVGGAPATLEILPDAGHTLGASHPMAEVPTALDRAVALSRAHFVRTLRDGVTLRTGTVTVP
ncbi:MAG: alpha/beta hydrolase family protein [Longimicrobiales bacterium]